jgi:uncharacterized cupin superfamily protein
MTDTPPVAIDARSAPVRSPIRTFPEPLASLMAKRERRPLGNLFGLANFGVNLTRLAPGGISAPRHYHSKQDEFVFILEGTPTLIMNGGETELQPGMCAGFKAGSTDAHHLVNKGETDVVYLEIGDRSSDDVVTYADDDIKLEGKLVVHKDGSPY